MLPLQVDLVGGGAVAIAVTFLLTTVFYAVTLHLAVLWVLGDEPHQRAAAVAPVPAVVSMLFATYGPLVVIPLSFVATVVAIRQIYRLETRGALLLTVAHFTIATVVGIALVNILFG